MGQTGEKKGIRAFDADAPIFHVSHLTFPLRLYVSNAVILIFRCCFTVVVTLSELSHYIVSNNKKPLKNKNPPLIKDIFRETEKIFIHKNPVI